MQYDYDTQKKGMLASITGDGHTQAFSYDDHCRIARTTETYPGLDEIYTKDYGFDKFGRQNLETFSDYGVTIENKYHEQSGALIEVGTNISGTFTSAWKATKDDVMGNITEWNTGNNTIPVTKDVEIESGNIREIDYGYGAGSLYNIEYDYYDDRNFKMRKHTFSGSSQEEYYAFDKMKQLIYSGDSLQLATKLNWDERGAKYLSEQSICYDEFGQKTYIEGVCAPGTTIKYDADGHIANPDSLITNNPLLAKEQTIRYNSRNRVECFQLDDDSLKFEYRPDTTKWRTKYYEDGNLKYTKYHFGNHEKFVYPDGHTKNLFYIFGGKELTGLYIKEYSSEQMGYVISDHLGSVWALANDQGGFIEHYAYDPCSRFSQTCKRSAAGLDENRNPDGGERNREGRRMVPTDWNTTDTTRTEFKTDRGFTLHVPYCSQKTSGAQAFEQAIAIPTLFVGKHYDHMQIINMLREMKSRRHIYLFMEGNARMYDPLMGQFISVDPLADKYPGWGGYVYCLNNPLIYTDPTGEYVYDVDANPELAELVEELRDAWDNSSDEFKDAFYETSGMNEAQVEEMLIDGKGPNLEVGELDTEDKSENGHYSGKRYSNGYVDATITIDNNVVDNAVKYPNIDNQSFGATDVFQSSVLHESVHYGRQLNKLPKSLSSGERVVSGCAGKNFEHKAYGKDLNRSDSKNQINQIKDMTRPLEMRLPESKIEIKPIQLKL